MVRAISLVILHQKRDELAVSPIRWIANCEMRAGVLDRGFPFCPSTSSLNISGSHLSLVGLTAWNPPTQALAPGAAPSFNNGIG